MTAKSMLLAAALVCATSCASAQNVYTQVDDDGRITFSDVPPVKPKAAPRRGGRVEVNEAARRLERAQTDRKLGVEPLPGELSNANGVRTVNYRYWRRQEKLRLAVELAQRRSSETLRPQLAAR